MKQVELPNTKWVAVNLIGMAALAASVALLNSLFGGHPMPSATVWIEFALLYVAIAVVNFYLFFESSEAEEHKSFKLQLKDLMSSLGAWFVVYGIYRICTLRRTTIDRVEAKAMARRLVEQLARKKR